jgi:hypothetical protein
MIVAFTWATKTGQLPERTYQQSPSALPFCGCHPPMHYSSAGGSGGPSGLRFVEEVFEVADGHGFGEVRVETSL